MAQKHRHDMGDGGYCICPKCGERTEHHRGVPCQEESCPNCGSKKLLREGSHHHQLFQQKQAEKQAEKHKESA